MFFFSTSALSSEALTALREFYGDRDAHQAKFEALQARARRGMRRAGAARNEDHDDDDDDVDSRNGDGRVLQEKDVEASISMDAFMEDWNASQFWVKFAVVFLRWIPNLPSIYFALLWMLKKRHFFCLFENSGLCCEKISAIYIYFFHTSRGDRGEVRVYLNRWLTQS